MSKGPSVPIIGGGPAGMSCALWLANDGLGPVIIERAPALGGMARLSPFPNDWLLGRPGETARENAEAFARHVQQAQVECWLDARPRRVLRSAGSTFEIEVTFTDGRPAQSLTCPALVIAVGTDFRAADWLDRVSNARALAARGRVHIGPGWAGEPGADLGSHVAVIGGGDNAFDVSRMLAEKGVRATIVMRSATPHARPQMVESLRAHQALGLAAVLAERTVAAVEEIGGKIRLRLDAGGTIEVDHVLLLLGYRPNTGEPWLAGLSLKQDTDGYLVVDGNMETSCPGVFAVGDVVNPAHPSIATAIASGTMAAREIQRRLAR
jgi:thioredoxin reductase (NADPH)